MLSTNPDLQIIVAHFDHGIRDDSAEDARFVAGLAARYDVSFESKREVLGADASEATARAHRYAFLRAVQEKHNAVAVVTAHHQDDVIETAALNVLRGTRRRGFVSLKSTSELRRPLLSMTKQQIRDYAATHRLEWIEDSTNASMKYLRNQVRARLHTGLSAEPRAKLVKLLAMIEKDNAAIDKDIAAFLENRGDRLSRVEFETIDAPVLYEIIAEWLRGHDAVFDKNTIVRICNGARNLQNNAKIDVDKHWYCKLSRTEIILTPR